VTTELAIIAPKYRGQENATALASFIRGSASRRELAPSPTRGAPMMTLSTRAAATAFASLLLMSSAFAQTTAPATPAPAAKTAPAAKAEKAPVVHTAASLECSKEADAKEIGRAHV